MRARADKKRQASLSSAAMTQQNKKGSASKKSKNGTMKGGTVLVSGLTAGASGMPPPPRRQGLRAEQSRIGGGFFGQPPLRGVQPQRGVTFGAAVPGMYPSMAVPMGCADTPSFVPRPTNVKEQAWKLQTVSIGKRPQVLLVEETRDSTPKVQRRFRPMPCPELLDPLGRPRHQAMLPPHPIRPVFQLPIPRQPPMHPQTDGSLLLSQPPPPPRMQPPLPSPPPPPPPPDEPQTALDLLSEAVHSVKHAELIPESEDERIYIETIQKWDVMCGRGGKSNHHSGNKRYRQVVAQMRTHYRGSRVKQAKTTLSRNIVDFVEKYGGRFVKAERGTGKYFLLTKAEAQKKTAQALRETKQMKWTLESRPSGGELD